MKNFIKYYQFLGKYKRRLALFLLITILGVILESVRPYWLKMILDSVQNQNFQPAFVYFWLFSLSTVGSNWLSSLSYFLGDRVLIPLSRQIRETVFSKIMDLDFAFHVNKNTGSLISAFRRGDGAVFNMFESIFHELLRVLVTLVVTLVFLFQASVEMAIILLVLFSLNLVLVWWLIKINLKARSEFNESDDEVAGVISDNMLNYETVKFFAAEKKESGRLARKLDVWTEKIWKFSNSFRLMDVTIGFTAGSGVLWILWLAINKVGHGFTGGDLVMISGFLTNFYYQFFNLFFRIREIAKALIDLDRYFGILDNKTEVKDPVRAQKISKLRGKIEFKNIGFVYPKNKDKIIDNINLTIKPGERVAFVGRSGAGKTTLTKLLLRFYDPSEGKILLDGVDIRKLKKTTLRSYIGVVPQEPIMFNNSIKFNLTYGREDATTEEIIDVAKKANILEFIEKLPQGWDTQVGERGIKLSGGQKQRLAIARALLTDPKILIFDEATSNLDSESEKQIQLALSEAATSRTVVIVAHRFSTIRDADRIVVLSNGNIMETGKHDELIAQNGLYHKLWNLQSKGKLDQEEGL